MYINKKEQQAISVAISIMDKITSDGYKDEDIDDALDVLIELQRKIRKRNLREPKRTIQPIDWGD